MSFIAITKVTYPEALEDQIRRAGFDIVAFAKKQTGLITIDFHRSTSLNETLMVWEWRDQLDHQRCMESEVWSLLLKKVGMVFNNEGVEFSIATYERLS